MRDEATRLAWALEWIARLPLCGEPELAGLLGVDEHDARRLTHELVKRGWTETLAASSLELEPRRLAVLRGEALPARAAACGPDLASLAGAVPVRPRDLLRRVARLEITACVNRFAADLAGDLESSGIVELADARSLPLAVPPDECWWLPGTEGYGCLRTGPLHAPFLVAWDRAAAPHVHRRRRLAGWFAASARVDRQWGSEGLPPVLVICPSARERRVWEDALAKRDGGGSACLEVLFTTREELHAAGADDARWWRPGRAPAPLVEQLGWGAAPVVRAIRIEQALDDCRPPPRRITWQARVRSGDERAGAAGLAASRRPRARDKPGREDPHRMGSAAPAPEHRRARSAHGRTGGTDQAPPGAAHALRRDRCGRRTAGAGTRQVNDVDEPRYLLTELGMRSIAARDGVPPAIFARHGGVTFASVS